VRRHLGQLIRSSLWMPGVPQSHIVSPQVLPYTWRTKFSTLIRDVATTIRDVATTGNSGSGVCLLGISHTTEGDKEVAKYFVSAVAIRDFMPVEFRP
jgi:hypothetical protein